MAAMALIIAQVALFQMATCASHQSAQRTGEDLELVAMVQGDSSLRTWGATQRVAVEIPADGSAVHALASGLNGWGASEGASGQILAEGIQLLQGDVGLRGWGLQLGRRVEIPVNGDVQEVKSLQPWGDGSTAISESYSMIQFGFRDTLSLSRQAEVKSQAQAAQGDVDRQLQGEGTSFLQTSSDESEEAVEAVVNEDVTPAEKPLVVFGVKLQVGQWRVPGLELHSFAFIGLLAAAIGVALQARKGALGCHIIFRFWTTQERGLLEQCSDRGS